MKASQVLRGYLAQKIVQLPLAGSNQADHDSGQAGDAPAVPPIEVGLLPLDPGKEAEIFSRARQYAIAKAEIAGKTNYEPREDDELYEFGKAIWRCLLGVVDAESDPHHPEPFFDGGIKQLEEMVELGSDGILLLSRMHCEYQDELSGLTAEIADASSPEFIELVGELAGPLGLVKYFSLRHGIAATCTLTMARLLLVLLPDRSSGGHAAAKSSTSEKSRQKKARRTRGKR